MKVIIVGAGLGGLACALACRREGIEVEVVERAREILPIGAGIQIPPNGTRVCQSLGIFEKIRRKATAMENIVVRRYSDGQILQVRQLGRRCIDLYGSPWMVIHRASYIDILLEEAKAAGARLSLGVSVTDIAFETSHVILEDGRKLEADVIVGADGLWSVTRDKLLGTPSPPVETGDLAYRATFTKEVLLAQADARVEELCSGSSATLWWGPDRHVVFYPIQGGEEFNLVLIRPDNIPPSLRVEQGDIEAMRLTFAGWDDILTRIISSVPSALKWKLCHHEELSTWQKVSIYPPDTRGFAVTKKMEKKGNVVLLGDACHPTLPYQAQGAAMAVEDGAILGRLLGLFLRSTSSEPENHKPIISDVLKFYEEQRKIRTTANVQGALNNRKTFHMSDGPQQVERDTELGTANYDKPSEFTWLDSQYNLNMLGFDAVKNAEEAFATWVTQR